MSGKKASEFSGEEQQQVIAEFERLTRDAAAVQPETLRRILDENAGVEYLQGLGLDGRTDPDTFRACVPLATHDDLEPYIARLADGDTSPVLTAKSITSISLRFVHACMVLSPCSGSALSLSWSRQSMQLRHDAGEAQVLALQRRAIQADDACVPDLLRLQEQVRALVRYVRVHDT